MRLASRRLYGHLLGAGVRIYEYERGMTHLKALIVDDLWAVIGTTNLDNRSFEHNDEVNVGFRDESLARRLLADYERDVAASREITVYHLLDAGRVILSEGAAQKLSHGLDPHRTKSVSGEKSGSS